MRVGYALDLSTALHTVHTVLHSDVQPCLVLHHHSDAHTYQALHSDAQPNTPCSPIHSPTRTTVLCTAPTLCRTDTVLHSPTRSTVLPSPVQPLAQPPPPPLTPPFFVFKLVPNSTVQDVFGANIESVFLDSPTGARCRTRVESTNIFSY